MMIQTDPKIAQQKRQLVCLRCERVGHTIRPCPLNHDYVFDAEKTAIRDGFE